MQYANGYTRVITQQAAQAPVQMSPVLGSVQLSPSVASAPRSIGAANGFTPAPAKGVSATDALAKAQSLVFNDKVMGERCGTQVLATFKQCLLSGAELPEAAKKAIAAGVFQWARENGATKFAHWFFPCRMGGGALGGSLGALKEDSLIDLVWSSDSTNKPFEACFPYERLFVGETDGSSFPNGGLRATHTAAAFTSWDRSSPMFILDDTLRIPTCFITHYGKCIDLKTPLLRASDAVAREGIRLLNLMRLSSPKARGAKTIHSYVGWEQEFFVVSAATFKARPDLVNCGRTLFGKLPPRNQTMDQQYFGPIPVPVKELLNIVSAKMLAIGSPMAVQHNEVAPAQHEMSPIFSVASHSCDSNVVFQEICTTEAKKLGLVVLFHEKPFAGINGNGKHNNWSVGTDTGINFFYPGKNDDERLCFTTGIAALAWGLCTYNELVRLSVAHAGNDHRLGAQEAPPAIISLYPGTGFEAHVDKIIAGGGLLDYVANKQKADPACLASEPFDTNVEDRNRTAPFPFCGNRFEFRAVGSSQNCALPTAICNTIWAAGAAHISEMLQQGLPLRDAVAATFQESRAVIFTGNGYSPEWPVEAERRGLPNDKTTPLAIKKFVEGTSREAFIQMGVYSPEECDALADTMYENYVSTLTIEVETMTHMVETAFIPAFAKDLSNYKDAHALVGERAKLYPMIKAENDKLKVMLASKPHDLAAEAEYLCNDVKPQMGALRELVDQAEGLMESSIYPFPTYETILYGHHF